MLEAFDRIISRWLRMESFRQVVGYTIVCTIFTTLVAVCVVGGALWPMPDVVFYFGVGIAAFIPIFITVPLAFVVFYMLLLITRTIDRVGALIQFDPLTGVLTRAHFLGETQRAFSQGGVFMMVDADHFKKINDTYGHDLGDSALKTLASSLTASVGDSGFVGRLGGEEFGVFLPRATSALALLMAQTIRTTVRASGAVIDGRAIGLTVSIGAAERRPGRSLDDAIKAADMLLYAAKRAGRDRAFIEGVTALEPRADATAA
ncbi:GGDEF domain-containing protein [Methylocystis sp. WRRC1]|uniref:GGDEF domain-containing protein n=1 Tax=unclassified Methylocystis TaxID=2625913 RepID=UPI0001F86EF1|nr:MULTISPECIES: diguanylate cyclase [unclassified Methylocystis]MCC3244947.1 GGDEF domain-containing protein [Methylocystis sp. WRRC1]